VARDRQRAKQRRARRNENPGPSPRPLHQEDVPGPLEHASGEVEEFEAALVSGADGEPQTEDEQPEDADGVSPRDREDLAGEHPEDLSDEDFDDVEDEVEEAGRSGGAPARRAAGTHAPVKARGGNRLMGFLRASWAELQRVQWPDRRQVGQATAVVLGFVVVAGAYLGLADAAAKAIVDFII
jgi:preprotein translocase SecE subunit